ncbi:MAG TPA: M23 family metallopeptidase [Steroidobacteraceae bacterium]|nr:M23 family metallopeptidase [Steroidobacteraceae bacterium]
MNLIFFSRRRGTARHLQLTHPLVVGVAALVGLAVLGATFALGVSLGSHSGANRAPLAEVITLRGQVQDQLNGLSVRLADLDAHVIRIDALGKRLTQMANISSAELNFDVAPGVGGPEEPADLQHTGARFPDITQQIDDLQRRLEQRDTQLLALENVILSRTLNEAVRPDGRPVMEGYISSYFGDRADPFDGHEAMHKGVDIAGQLGAQVLAVATGVVTRAGAVSGYGNLVEINHGNGYATRYAHNETVLVAVGDMVTRGQPIALMGSTGRSTGPHLHFEVLRDGQQVDPLSYIDP